MPPGTAGIYTILDAAEKRNCPAPDDSMLTVCHLPRTPLVVALTQNAGRIDNLDVAHQR